MRILIALIIFLGTSSLVFSQEIGEETKNGQLYKIHAVEAGNTLYGLHLTYKTSIEKIIKANPSAKEGLQIGQVLRIPVEKEIDEKEESEEEYTIHTVKRKETLYGISRNYGCKIADIIRLNPEVEDGLDVRQKIKIPISKPSEEKESQEISDTEKEENENTQETTVLADSTVSDSSAFVDYEIEFQDSIVEYKVKKGETLYSISRRFMVPVEQLIEQNDLKNSSIKPGQILNITLKQERIKEVEVREIVRMDTLKKADVQLVKKQDQYNVLVLLPIKISANSEALSGVFTESTSLNRLTDLSVEFLMGAQMALDSLEKLGLNAEVEFFDTEGSLEKIKKKLTPQNDNELDLVIGPFYPNLLEYTAKWGKTNKVPVVAVTKIKTKLLENNPYLLSMVPSELTMVSAMAKYLAKNHSKDNIVLIQGENAAVKDRVEYFKSVFEGSLEKSVSDTNNYKVSITEIGSSSGRHLMNYIHKEQDNYFVCLSNNVQRVMKFVNALNAAKNYSPTYGRANVYIAGLQGWFDMPAFNSYYRNRFEFHFASSSYLNYDKSNVKTFTKDYRSRYESDPSKYAFHGFDVFLSQGASLLLGYNRNVGLMDYFRVQSLGRNHGSENSSVFISKQKDFEIQMLEIISNTNHFDVQRKSN